MGNNIRKRRLFECYVPIVTHNSLHVSSMYISHSNIIHVKQLFI